MKNKPNPGILWRQNAKKFLITMKISLLLLMLVVLKAYSTNIFSQNTTSSLNMQNVTVREVVSEIERQGGINFHFNDNLEGLSQRVSVSFEDTPIKDILENTLSQADMMYEEINDDFVVLLSRNVINNQQITVTGRVTDEATGEPLPGTSIIIRGTTTGTATDINGEYRLQVPGPETVLVYSFLGYTSQEIVVGDNIVINIELKADLTILDEVVAIGYGVVRRSDLTGSVTTVRGDDLAMQAVGNPVQALTGLSSGVQVLIESGQPGANIDVLIRGGNSLLGGTSPLYVVDGFPISGDLRSLNPNDIESVEILKDASATAIYGSRGANGVVLVTTKKGQEGVTSVEYHGYYGIQKVSKTIDMLNAKEFATLANIRAANDGMAPYFTDAEIASFGEGTNWQDEIFQLAPIQNHSLSVSGGTGVTKFNISGNYFDQDGIIINSEYQNLQLRVNIDHKVSSNWKVALNSTINKRDFNNILSQNTERGMGALSGALVVPPTISPQDEAGNYNNVRPYPFSPDIAENPVAIALERRQLARNNSMLINLFAEGKITSDLILYSSLGAEYDLRRGDFYSPSIFQFSAVGSANTTYTENYNIVNENTLTYSKNIAEDHSITVLGGLTSQITTNQYLGASSTGFLSDILLNYNLAAGSSVGTPSSGYSEYTIFSGLGRINYAYKGKYLITASYRADGSSRFGRENKWGYFPSAAIAWRVSEEEFLKGNEVISNLKLRASWGKTGNTAISPYQSLAVLNNVQGVFDKNIVIGYAPGGTKPNPELRWESTTQIDFGTDIGFLNNQLLFTLDYYKKITDDLLASVPVPPSTGYSTQITNLGEVMNKGFEISINSNIFRENFSWSLGANLSINRNEVLSLPGGGDIFGTGLGNALPAMSLVREGHPIGVFYGYVEDGLTENGLIKYVDINNDGEITGLDRTIIGDPNPDFIYGISSTFSYGNIGLSILINGSQGNDILAYNHSNLADGFAFGINQIRDVLGNYWTQENPDPNAKYPRISRNTRYLGSDRFIEDGSYLQVKNVMLSYTLTRDRFQFLPVNRTEFYLNIQNLITITNYPYYSPIVNTRGTGISKGIDQFGYPDARNFMFGIKANF